MPLTFAPPPTDAFAALQGGLQAVARAQRNAPTGGGTLTLDAAPSARKPHPVYILGIREIVADKGIEDARLAAWRYLLVDNQQVRQAAEVVSDRSGGSQFASLTNGFVLGAEQALAQAENMPEIAQGNYEIRALRVPELYLMAFWMKDLQGTQDRCFLLPPIFPPFQAGVAYIPESLMTVLKAEAVAKLAQDQAANGSQPQTPRKPRQ